MKRDPLRIFSAKKISHDAGKNGRKTVKSHPVLYVKQKKGKTFLVQFLGPKETFWRLYILWNFCSKYFGHSRCIEKNTDEKLEILIAFSKIASRLMTVRDRDITVIPKVMMTAHVLR